MPIGKLAKWQILLSEFDIVYVTQKAIKGQALADHLAENLVDKDYEPFTAYFSDEEVFFAGEDIVESYTGWRMFFDGATNYKGIGIGTVLVSESGQHYPASGKIRFPCTNNMAEYEACILGIRVAVDMNIKEILVIGDSDLLIHQVQGQWTTKNVKILPYLLYVTELCKKFKKIEFKNIPRIQNEFAYAFVTLSSMIQHPDKNYIDPIEVEIRDQYAYYFYVDEEPYANLNSDLMRKICEKFKIVHHNSTAYKPQMNGAVEAANKNIKRILRNIVDNHRQWHEKLSFALLGYQTSTRETPYMLVFGTEAMIPIKVEILSLRVIQEAKLDDAKWIRVRQE
ncbi:uncharacterized protein LOC142180124 [Nicotiana tabacum]|uniref:Uncharacterized protein LOC142180124 n=1 Tax=Nicotiana tabacum TaxID=4097 RepID=A0AC58UCF9_TOBAC